MAEVRPDSTETRRLLEEAAGGESEAFGRLFERHRAHLCEIAEGRLDVRVRPRIDPSDVVQETQVEAFKRLDDYLRRRPMPFRLWLVKTLYERLRKIEQHHLAAAKRSIHREVPLPDRSSLKLAAQLLSGGTSPSADAIREELARQVRRLLARLPEKEREILLLRDFENLSNDEAACLLEISPEAAKKRHARALLALKRLLSAPGLEESGP